MKHFLAIALASSVALAACSSDDDGPTNTVTPPPGDDAPTDPPPTDPPVDDGPITGTFGPGISGVRFTTATQSGLTDVDGTFSYEPGEAVAFTLGGIALGSALGAERVNVFDIVGVATPTNHDRMVRELSDQVAQPFERGVNIAILLMGMDADGDVANGIDLTGRDEQLVNTHVSFERRSNNFVSVPETLAARIPNFAISRTSPNTSVPAAIAYIYGAAGIAINGHARVTIARDDGNNGEIDSTQACELDANGIVTRITRRTPEDLLTMDSTYERDSAQRVTVVSNAMSSTTPGTLDRRTTTTFGYTPTGPLESMAITGDNSSTRAFTYGVDGRLTRVESDSSVQNYAWNEATGTLVATYVQLASNGDVSSTASETSVYDMRGRLISSVSGADDSSVPRQSNTYTFDDEDNLLTLTVESNSGTVSTTTYAYENRLVTREERAFGGRTFRFQYTYADGQLATETTTTQVGDSAAYRSSFSEWTYDTNGNLLRSISTDYSSDGNPSESAVVAYLLDTDGYATEELSTGPFAPDLATIYSLQSTRNPVVTTLLCDVF